MSVFKSPFEIQAGVARRIGRARQLTDEQDSSWAAARRILVEAGLTPPLVAELPIDLETVHELVRRGELVQVAPTLAYLPDQVTDLQRALAAMADGFTVADFRDNLGVSRKYAVPILEWADRQGLTRRQGDRRYPRRDR